MKTTTLPRIAIIGYGSQGRAHALNLRDSGFDVVIGLRSGGPTEAIARTDRFSVLSPAQAVQQVDLVAVLTPDMVQEQLYADILDQAMMPGACLLFAHGLSIHAKLITPRHDLDVVLVAPKGPGNLVRREYTLGRGVPCLWAIHQDRTGSAEKLAKLYADGIGGSRAGLLKTSFKEETETDLFGEQAVLCGGISMLMQAGYETLVETGYQGEVAYFEVLHEMKLIVDLIYEGGMTRMLEFISETAQYGDYVSGPRVIDAHTKQQMKQILLEIQNGTFTKNWIREYKSGLINYKKYHQTHVSHPIEKIGKALRAQMPWLNPQSTQRAASSPQQPEMA